MEDCSNQYDNEKNEIIAKITLDSAIVELWSKLYRDNTLKYQKKVHHEIPFFSYGKTVYEW